jgi:predicted PurR-regulated permease PerM
MSEAQPVAEPNAQGLRTAVEITVRLGALLLLGGWCLVILAPFASIVVWAVIIAVACDGLFARLAASLGGRRGLAATLLVVVALSLLIVPSVLLSSTLLEGAQSFSAKLEAGEVLVPPPPERVADWPIVGDRVYDGWKLASQNLDAALTRLRPQLQALSGWLLSAAGSAGVALLQLVGSLILAGFMLMRGEGRHAAIVRFASRISGERGPELAELTRSTIKSVVQGILGIAVIQTVLASAGFLLVDVPAAGLWALLVLVAAVVQLPVLLVMVPPVLLVFSGGASTLVAVIFTVWCIVVGVLDNALKPILLGRSVEVPTLVIFLGAIGGMLMMGIVGLFLGAVVLTLGYELFSAWLAEADESPPEAASSA